MWCQAAVLESARPPRGIAEDVEQPYRVIVQNVGTAFRMPMRRLREEFRRGGEFQEFLLRFSALARWLLMMRDRTTSNALELTQEFLSHMLGARVASLNEAIRALSQDGLIKHTRGSVEILDRQRLEQAACECYRFVKNRNGIVSPD